MNELINELIKTLSIHGIKEEVLQNEVFIIVL